MRIEEKVDQLIADLPARESFWRIGDLTALRQDSTGMFYRSNYERGPLLYALVAKYRPRTILEVGTGRGYGALCMARALVERDIDGRVYTIDTRGYDERQPWWIDEGPGPEVRSLSWSDVWPRHFERAWLDRIERLHGTSWEVMGRWTKLGLPSVDLAFIDGGHDYATVKHDFWSVLEVGASAVRVVLDDYTAGSEFGVQRLVDEELVRLFTPELIETRHRPGSGQAHQAGEQPDGMVLLEAASPTPSPPEWLTFVASYRRRAASASWLKRAKQLASRLMHSVRAW